eukprot:809742-Amphidinium_carterae.1
MICEVNTHLVLSHLGPRAIGRVFHDVENYLVTTTCQQRDSTSVRSSSPQHPRGQPNQSKVFWARLAFGGRDRNSCTTDRVASPA